MAGVAGGGGWRTGSATGALGGAGIGVGFSGITTCTGTTGTALDARMVSQV